MSGIIFNKTQNLEKIRKFYIERINMNLWLEQKDCIILKHGNLLLGFCQREEIDNSGIITFFYRSKETVESIYKKLADISISKPVINRDYNIYQFFAEDPEGRTIEFQSFLHYTDPHIEGREALITRRSIREFKDEIVSDEIMWKIFEICRFSPSSRNSESYYYIVIDNTDIKDWLASIRGDSSSPIGKAPVAVAVCTDPGKTKRPIQDGCIAAYHFLLTSWLFGLGTCWIAAMDRDDVKDYLKIPKNHYIATITPLGYPVEVADAPIRRNAKDIVKFIF